MVKLSIIVPIYGVEQYLRKCVDSLLAQDYDDYEIILVDDGSPDSCPQICDEYARMNETIVRDRSRKELENEGVRELVTPFINVIHRKNGGLSAARNSGIEVAQGEYVMFVDSDDYIKPNVLRGLLKQVDRDDLDVLRYDFQNVRIVDREYEIFKPNKAPKRDVNLSEEVTDGETFLNERLGPSCYASQFILRRALLNDCLFTPGIYFEDTEWTPRMLVRAKRVASTEKVVYNYLWREGSITLPDNPKKREKVLRDKIALIRGFKEQCKLVREPQWFTWMTSFTAMTILGMLAHLSSAERKPYLKELKSLDIFPLSIKKERMLSHKIKIVLANLSPSLYCILMSLRK
jgi:glycosyltransferase involved in cell wall biosynthesis